MTHGIKAWGRKTCSNKNLQEPWEEILALMMSSLQLLAFLANENKQGLIKEMWDSEKKEMFQSNVANVVWRYGLGLKDTKKLKRMARRKLLREIRALEKRGAVAVS